MSVQTLRESNFFWVCLFFSLICSSDRRTNRRTDGRTMDRRSGHRRYFSPLSWSPAASVNWRLRDWLELRARHWSNGRRGVGGVGVPMGRTPPPPLPVHVPVMSWRRDLSYQWMNTYLSACFGYTAMGNITWLLLNDLYSCSFIKDLLYRCII